MPRAPVPLCQRGRSPASAIAAAAPAPGGASASDGPSVAGALSPGMSWRAQYARLQRPNGSTNSQLRCTKTRPMAASALPPLRVWLPHEYASTSTSGSASALGNAPPPE